MIRVNRPNVTTLPQSHRTEIAQERKRAGRLSARDPEIKRVWKNFRARNSGKAVTAVLSNAFHTKCVYCERVNAKTIDHYYPKERYPKRMFRWNNLLLCCSDCNRSKGEAFEFRDRTPLFLDPTAENPAEFFDWDVGTGSMLLVAEPLKAARGRYTRDKLDLDVGPLREQRRKSIEIVRSLFILVNLEPIVEQQTRDILSALLSRSGEYLGIVRFWLTHLNPSDRNIYDAARAKLPEIDTWVVALLSR